MTADLAASILARLRHVARERGEDPQLVLARFVNERLLFRLSVSPSSTDFILKGATLFLVWNGRSHRVTRDLDLLGRGTPDEARLVSVFRDICQIHCDDALVFDSDSVAAAPIREGASYSGVRVRLRALLGRADLPVQVDIGFGDVVTPGPLLLDVPVLLGLPAPRMNVYPRESVVAEKVHAMVVLGRDNSRMKDFHDVWLLLRELDDDVVLERAIRATFARRGTALPTTLPDAWTDAFGVDPEKQRQWTAFLRRSRAEPRPSLSDVVSSLRGRLAALCGDLA